MIFGQALEAVKQGTRIARTGWNGKDQYVILIPGAHLAKSAGYGFGEAMGEFAFGDVLALKNAQGVMQPGWVPSQGDLFAQDWYVIGSATEGMPPHQARVVEELDQLRDRLGKLTVFMDTDLFNGLDNGEKMRLRQQSVHMQAYMDMLQRRIDNFK